MGSGVHQLVDPPWPRVAVPASRSAAGLPGESGVHGPEQGQGVVVQPVLVERDGHAGELFRCVKRTRRGPSSWTNQREW
jgi:hypothetical protein